MQAADGFMSVASPLNIVPTFRNAEIDLGFIEGELVCRITPKSTQCLMAAMGKLHYRMQITTILLICIGRYQFPIRDIGKYSDVFISLIVRCS
jgi:hypothetical protein